MIVIKSEPTFAKVKIRSSLYEGDVHVVRYGPDVFRCYGRSGTKNPNNSFLWNTSKSILILQDIIALLYRGDGRCAALQWRSRQVLWRQCQATVSPRATGACSEKTELMDHLMAFHCHIYYLGSISLNGMKASMDMSTWMKRMNMNIENIEHKINKYREVTKYISNFSVEFRCAEGKTIHKFSFFFLSSDWVEMEGNSQYCVIHLQTCQRSRNCLRSEDGERVFTGERGPPTPLCRSQTSPQPEDVNAAENLERTKPWQ